MIYISKELYLYISYVIKNKTKRKKTKLEKQQPENSMYRMYNHEGMLGIKGGVGGQ